MREIKFRAWWEDVSEEPNLVPDQIFLVGSRVCIDYKSVEAGRKAVEKIEAWERLKDKGFRFDKRYRDNTIHFRWSLSHYFNEIEDDLNLLFGGEE